MESDFGSVEFSSEAEIVLLEDWLDSSSWALPASCVLGLSADLQHPDSDCARRRDPAQICLIEAICALVFGFFEVEGRSSHFS